MVAGAFTTKARQLSPSWPKSSPLSLCITSRWKMWRDFSRNPWRQVIVVLNLCGKNSNNLWFSEISAQSGETDQPKASRYSGRVGQIWKRTTDWALWEKQLSHWRECVSHNNEMFHRRANKNVVILVSTQKNNYPTNPLYCLSWQKVTTFAISAINRSSGDEMALDTNVSMFSVLRKHFSAWRETTEKSGVSCKSIQLFKVMPHAAVPMSVWLSTWGPPSQHAELNRTVLCAFQKCIYLKVDSAKDQGPN